jgi:hypothetical protein
MHCTRIGVKSSALAVFFTKWIQLTLSQMARRSRGLGATVQRTPRED